MKKVAIITGGSSGIGKALARNLNANGFRVYEFSRHQAEHPAGIIHIPADVTDERQIRSAVAKVLETEGRVDVLVCNAGFGISGAAEFTDNSTAGELLKVNLFGAVNCIREILPAMRAQHSGRIVCISSVAAPIAIPFQSWYSVSKAALSAYASALREEIRPFGIEVCIVMPGDIQTGFTDARRRSETGDDVYGGRIARSVAVMEHDERTGMTAEQAAARIGRIVRKRRVKPEYVVGTAYRAFVMLHRWLPRSLSGRIVGFLYAK